MVLYILVVSHVSCVYHYNPLMLLNCNLKMFARNESAKSYDLLAISEKNSPFKGYPKPNLKLLKLLNDQE